MTFLSVLDSGHPLYTNYAWLSGRWSPGTALPPCSHLPSYCQHVSFRSTAGPPLIKLMWTPADYHHSVNTNKSRPVFFLPFTNCILSLDHFILATCCSFIPQTQLLSISEHHEENSSDKVSLVHDAYHYQSKPNTLVCWDKQQGKHNIMYCNYINDNLYFLHRAFCRVQN